MLNYIHPIVQKHQPLQSSIREFKMQNQTLWLKSPAAIFTGNALNAGNGLVIKGNKIVELVPSGMKPKIHVDSYIDCSNQVVTPGLINTHHHFYQTLTRAVPGALNKPLFPWLKYLYQIWKNLRRRNDLHCDSISGIRVDVIGRNLYCRSPLCFPKGA